MGISKETPKLEAGKWYKYPDHENWKLCITSIDGDDVRGYGVDLTGGWMGSGKWGVIEDKLDELIECTLNEVKDALEKEAKRRYKVGDKVISHQGIFTLQTLDCKYIDKLECNGIYSIQGYGVWLFLDGKWAEVIEQQSDKFAELKEAHRKGAVIQYKNWTTKYFLDCHDNLPKWNESTEYRIKPQQSSLEQDIQQLKDKYKQYKFTITIEDNI